MPGFLLGLSTGVSCVVYCAPALLPYMIGRYGNFRTGLSITIQFLGGRLAGYFLFALLAWATNRLLLQNPHYHSMFYGLAYLSLTIMLFVYGLKRPESVCAGRFFHDRTVSAVPEKGDPLPIMLGFLTGLNLCPPFLLAFAGAAGSGSLWGSLTYFAAFFLGTSVYFLPAPLLGMLSRRPAWRQVGRWAALIVGAYYFYIGLMTFFERIIR